ncbi:MAG: transporter substrate-binding protein [Brevibacillus sp.]|nr:transporter substrate-binding protein [Brevibacillus sp.]
MNVKPTQRKNVMLSLLLSASMLAACSSQPASNGSQNAATTSGSSTPAATTSQPAPANGQPAVGGTLVVGTLSGPDTLNPLVSNTTPGSWVVNNLYPHLMQMNPSGKKEPYLAESVTTSEDGLTVTIKLRDGVNWQDGQPITSEDVAFTGQLLHDKKLQWTAEIFDQVAKVETPDKRTVVYTLKGPYPAFSGAIGYWVRIVPKHIWEKVDDPKSFENKEPVGAGPFKLVAYEKGQYLELAAIDKWFAAPGGRPYLDKVIFKIYPDANTMTLALQKGEVDVTSSDLPTSAAKLLATNPSIKVEQTASLGFAYYSFNTDDSKGVSPTQDVNFRQAMATATDRNTILNVALEGAGMQIDTPISPLYADWINPDAKAPAYDATKAKEILKTAGYSDTDGDGILNAPSSFGSKNVEPEVIYDGANVFHQKVAKILEKNASDIGVKLVLKPVEYNTLVAKVFNERDFQMHIGKWGVLDEPSETFSNLYHSKAKNNMATYTNTEMDRLSDGAKYAKTEQIAMDDVKAAQALFIKEFPVVPIYVQKFNLAYNADKFGGFTLFPGDLQGLVDPNSLVGVYKK